MPQTCHVVLCVSCKCFQVQLVKKVNKWTCKVCNTKQSVQQVYCKGTGAECRSVVIQLNEAKGNLEERENQVILDRIEAEQDEEDNGEEYYESEEQDLLPQTSGILTVPPTKSKWTIFLENSEAD